MKIESLYRDYVQKSKLFLYPLLDIKRGVSITPINTFLSWEGKYCFTDSKLICHYHIRKDKEFKLFEDVKLLGNPLFYEMYHLEKTGIYIFDLTKYEADFWAVVQGKYSMIHPGTRRKILDYWRTHSKRVYVESYLYPKKFYPMYSQILNVEIQHLKAAGELCDKPDLEKENLKSGVKIMNLIDNPLNLQR